MFSLIRTLRSLTAKVVMALDEAAMYEFSSIFRPTRIDDKMWARLLNAESREVRKVKVPAALGTRFKRMLIFNAEALHQNCFKS